MGHLGYLFYSLLLVQVYKDKPVQPKRPPAGAGMFGEQRGLQQPWITKGDDHLGRPI